MKKIAMVSTLLCALAFVAGPRKCEHKCCQKAAEDGKVCEKCHPKKSESK